MMTITTGIDVGSTYTKVVLADAGGKLLGKISIPTGYNFAKAADDALHLCLQQAGMSASDVAYVASTGFGRHQVPSRHIAITELTSHARAAFFLFPTVRTVLDVGGQGVKAIRLDERGRVKGFRLNDKCAAGSGAFLEKTMGYLGYDVEDIVPLSEGGTDPAIVSSVCAVFAESEVINHLTAGRTPEDICAGSLVSLANRSAQLVKRVRPESELMLSGGLSRVPLMKRVLEKELKCPFHVAEDGLGVFAGALGAALLAHERLRKLAEQGSA